MKERLDVATIDVRRLFRLTLIVFGLELAFVAGWWAGYTAAGWRGLAPRGPDGLSYACPRHPSYQSSERGNCPVDGFRLEPVHEDPPGPPATEDPSGSLRRSPRRSHTGENVASLAAEVIL